MVPDDQLHLLTAAVDGELNPEEAVRLRRVLAASADARTLLARLQADRTRIRNLPTTTPPADLRDRILAKVNQAPLPIPQPVVEPATNVPAPLRHAHRFRSWVPLGVSASLLIGVSAASFLFFVRLGEQPSHNGGNAVAARNTITPHLPREDRNPSAPIHPGPGVDANFRADAPAVVPAPEPLTGNREFVGPPFLPNNPVFTGPIRPPVKFEAVRARVPFLVPMTELERDDVRQQFAEELARDPSYRIDLFASDPNRAAEVFLTNARANGLAVFIDSAALDRIRRKQPGSFVIYTESLTPDEIRDLFGKLAADDARHSLKVFDTVHATAFHPADAKELRDVLGFDPGLGNGKRLTPGPMTIREQDPKPISAGTGDHVVKALGGPGAKPAVMLSFSPRVNPMTSKELADYRARRGERKPNTIPVMIVIRHPGG